MTNYNIYKSSPANSGSLIHRNFNEESAKDFLKTMSEGGYDGSLTDGSLSDDGLHCDCLDGGDRIVFFASKIEE